MFETAKNYTDPTKAHDDVQTCQSVQTNRRLPHPSFFSFNNWFQHGLLCAVNQQPVKTINNGLTCMSVDCPAETKPPYIDSP